MPGQARRCNLVVVRPLLALQAGGAGGPSRRARTREHSGKNRRQASGWSTAGKAAHHRVLGERDAIPLASLRTDGSPCRPAMPFGARVTELDGCCGTGSASLGRQHSPPRKAPLEVLGRASPDLEPAGSPRGPLAGPHGLGHHPWHRRFVLCAGRPNASPDCSKFPRFRYVHGRHPSGLHLEPACA